MEMLDLDAIDQQTAYVVCSIELVTTTPDELLKTIGKLNELVERAIVKGGKGTGTYVIATDVIDAGAILLFLYYAFKLRKQGWSIAFGGDGVALEEIARHLGHWALPKVSRSSVIGDGKVFLMREIGDRNEMVGEIEEWADHVQQSTSASGEQVANWKCQIGELTTNSFQHGGPKGMLLLAGRAKSNNTVSLAVLDFGVTIPTTIRNHPDCPKEAENDGDCVKFACRKGITARSVPENQGAGLYGITEAVKNNGGSMQILSGNGIFHLTGQRRDCRNLPSAGATSPTLDGTLVTMNLEI